MIDDPEEEAWMELERKQSERTMPALFKPVRVKSFEDAFSDYLDNPGAPRTAGNEEVRRHFMAGWVAGIRNEWAKERND
jgi:hypothetical protein